LRLDHTKKNGTMILELDRKLQISTFTYDALDRRILSGYDDGSTTSFTYDTAGRLTVAEDSGSGRIEFSYDNLDRLVQELTPQGIMQYQYDGIGRRTNMTVNGQTPVTYQYDSSSRLTQIAQGTQIVGLGYDQAGRRTSLTYPNGVNTNYTYDTASRLTNILHEGPSSIIEHLSYTYDAAGNRISFTRTNGSATLLPDAVQAAYDAANEQIQFDSTTPNLTYDANGNLTSQTVASGTTIYTWDSRNRLVAISGPGVSASFVYDALGRGITKTINGETTGFQYDGNDIVSEENGAAVTVTYLRSLNIDEPFIRQGSSDEFYHVDALGSSVVLTDSSGAIDTFYEYEAFGETTVNGPSTNPFQYTGRENDGRGLYYYRARHYSPTYKRFMGEDPLEFGGRDVNLYSYVFNNPINLVDPTGKAIIAPMPKHCLPESGRKDSRLKGFFRDIACDPANIIPGVGMVRGPTQGMIRNFEQQLAKHGKKSLEKALRSLEKRLGEHLEKLSNLDYRGVVEREIRNFEAQIEAIKQVLGRQQ